MNFLYLLNFASYYFEARSPRYQKVELGFNDVIGFGLRRLHAYHTNLIQSWINIF